MFIWLSLLKTLLPWNKFEKRDKTEAKPRQNRDKTRVKL